MSGLDSARQMLRYNIGIISSYVIVHTRTMWEKLKNSVRRRNDSGPVNSDFEQNNSTV